MSWHRPRQRRGSRVACGTLRRPARGSSGAADLVLDAPGVREDARPRCSANTTTHRGAGGVCDDSRLGADRANSRPASRKRRQKGEDGAFAVVLLADLDALQAQRYQHRSRIRRSRLIRRTSRQPRVVQEVRVGNAPRARKSRSHAGFRSPGWRDPDSNRGHHDFQSWVHHGRMWPLCSENARGCRLAVCPNFPPLSARLHDIRAHDLGLVPE